MSRPRASLERLERLHLWEYLVRFAFGGAITALAGWAGGKFGLAVGGMLLAFPAILPASLTLVKQHDGRRDACDDARGGRLGAVALAGFALVVAVTATRLPVWASLILALATWAVVAIGLWRITLARR